MLLTVRAHRSWCRHKSRSDVSVQMWAMAKGGIAIV